MDLMKSFGCWLKGLILLAAVGLLAGCADPAPNWGNDPLGTNGPAITYDPNAQPIIHVGDVVLVTFQDLVPPITPVEQAVKEDGKITLIYNKSFRAADRTPGQLEEDIHAAYTNYFKFMTPTVTLKERFYEVDGEVKSPGRFVYIGRMTVLQAIATASGFNEFANRKNVKIIRANGKSITINAVKALTDPKENVEIFPNDTINVPKRIF